jgi:ribosomal-protein-alanine N-acetyltransferase
MIREMTANDLSKVGDLYKDANLFTNKKNILNWTKRNLLNFSKYHLVFEEKYKIIGAISGIIVKNKVASIEDIAVHKEHRGRKIGSRLIKRIISKFEKDGIKKVKLWVHWTDARAIPFYYSHDFKIKKIGKTKNEGDIPNGEDIIFMEREI